MKTKTAPEKVLEELPRTFKTMDVKRLMYKLGFSPSSYQPVLEELVISEQVERIAHGKYRKVNG